LPAAPWRRRGDPGGRSWFTCSAVRFIHFSLFGGTLLSLHYYAVDTAVCMIAGFFGFRAARAAQMVTQYRWINAPDGMLGWRRREP
jgi:Domain of unknown function (DUF6867)